VQHEDGVATVQCLGPCDTAALLVAAAIPYRHTTSIGCALEGVVIDAVVGDLNGQALDGGVERWALWQCPGLHDAGDLEAQVEVARAGGVLLNDEDAGADATDGELLVPLLCAIYFFCQREATAFAFCSFWFFENFPYIGTYMADARTSALPLVGSEESDWTILFTQWGLLVKDQQIGATTRAFGWLGMLATVAWLAWRIWRVSKAKD